MDKLSEQILNSALDRAKTQFPDIIEHKEGIGSGTAKAEEKLSLADNFFDRLQNTMARNGAVSLTFSEDDVTMGARASVFATSVVTRIYLMDKVKKNIDDYIADPKNEALFEGMNADQKRVLANNLKNRVTEEMSVKPESKEGKAFVQAMTDKFNEMTAASEDEARSAYDSEIDPPEQRFLMEGLSVVHALNWEILGRDDVPIDMAAKMKGADQVQNQEFLGIREENFKKSLAATREGFRNSEVAGIILDGIEKNKTELARDTKLGPTMAAKEEQPDFLMPTPQINVEFPKKLGFWERFINSIKSLLGIGKEKTAEAEVEKENTIQSNREKISFEELSGLNAVSKLTSAPKQKELSTEKTAEKADPSKGK